MCNSAPRGHFAFAHEVQQQRIESIGQQVRKVVRCLDDVMLPTAELGSHCASAVDRLAPAPGDYQKRYACITQCLELRLHRRGGRQLQPGDALAHAPQFFLAARPADFRRNARQPREASRPRGR